jgi:hypothetical protein
MHTLRGNVFTELLPSNGYTCHGAPSLRLFVPNSLQVCSHFFSSKGCACNACDRSHLPSRGSAFRDVHSPTAPAAPSLRQLVPSSFLMRCQSVQVFHHHASPISGGKLPKVACAPTFPAVTPCAVAFCI